jgi:DNA-binding GntR family transcriptional regulator
MQDRERSIEPSIPSHERVFRLLRNEIMFGELQPGQSLTIRGIAEKYNVSMTPAREAVRRLSAEGALTLSKTSRVSTPVLGMDRIEELASLRALLEPELASRALPRVHSTLIDRLTRINSVVDQMAVKRDAVGYIRANIEFHRTLYLRAQAPAILAMAETVWLQMGPTMGSLYSRLQRQGASDNHRAALSALHAGDEPGLRLAIRADVTTGLRMLAQ